MRRRHLIAGLGATALAATERPGSAAAPDYRVGSALPDPPFELMTDKGPIGFDMDLTRLIAKALGRPWRLVPYEGANFNDIFAGLGAGTYDCIASGTTATRGRAQIVDFCAPYAVSGQSLVVNAKRLPKVKSIDDLKGLTIGVQAGNTSQPVADKLVAEGRAAAVKVYAYDQIETALGDVSAGRCDAVMKLAPVMQYLLRSYPDLRIVQTAITCEFLAISVRKGDPLRDDINRIQAGFAQDGTLDRLIAKWLKAGTASIAGADTLFPPEMLSAAFR
ncbi:ABC transporter substrate-binding protein [Aquabacter sp. CN5-332]|uniref:ABC transporter substrate-binding protein n=1 Tax=Aquabacter sp. CN5-332 TaxID=3156608 RepID=UPI0032B3825E